MPTLAQNLLSFAAAMSLILALWFLYLVYVQIIDRKSGFFWSLQLFFFSAGCLIIALRAVYPRFYEILPGAVLIVFSALLTLRSFHKLLGVRRQSAWLVGLILPVLISQATYAWLWPQRAMRLILSGAALALLAFYLAYALWIGRLNEFRRTACAASVTFIIVGAFQLLRVVAGIASAQNAEQVSLPPPPLPWLDVALLAYLPLTVWSFVPSLSYLALYLEKLRTHEQDRQFLLDFALESTVDAVWDYHISTNELRLFRDWEKMIGYEKGGLKVGIDNLAAITHPVDWEKMRLVFEEYAAGKRPAFDCRVRMRAKSGEYLWLKTRGIIAGRDASGKPLRIIGTIKNIDAEVKRELQAEEDALLLNQVFESSPSAIAVINRQKRLLRANPRLYEFARADTIELLRRRLEKGDFWQLDETGKPRHGYHPLSLRFENFDQPLAERFGFSDTENGPITWFLVQTAPVTELDLLLLMATDITDLVSTQSELLAMKADLEQIVARRTEELREINRELEAFAYSLSHDLRAPVSRAENWLSLLLHTARQKLDDKERNFLAHVQNELLTMKRMIAAMLVLSRVSQQHLALTSVNLGKKVHEILKQLQAEYPAEQIEIELLNEATIYADSELVRLLLRNLLENAVKFSRGQNPIRISIDAQPQDGMVLISVRDNGVGFDMRYADKLFAPLQRLHSEQEFPGTGIGLATAQRIVHRLGGKIWAESEPGKGAAFFFTLPARMPEQ